MLLKRLKFDKTRKKTVKIRHVLKCYQTDAIALSNKNKKCMQNILVYTTYI